MTVSEIKALAKRQLKGQWVNAVAVLLLGGLMVGAAGMLGALLGPFSILAVMAVNAPLTLGTSIFYLKAIRGGKAEVTDLFQGFRQFPGAFVLLFLQSLFIFLWSLLLVIPGIMKAYSYAMSFYILADHPELSANEAMKRSAEMMKGHRLQLFGLQLSYIGWVILCFFTFGLANLYMMPYMSAAIAGFYLGRSGNSMPSEQAEALPEGPARRDTEVLGISSPQTTVLDENPEEGIFTGLTGSFEGADYVLEDGVEYSVGRDGELCGIVVHDGNTSISRVHCKVQFSAEQDGYYITDCSSNGTFADDVKLEKDVPQFVPRGTVISLGNKEESFRLD